MCVQSHKNRIWCKVRLFDELQDALILVTLKKGSQIYAPGGTFYFIVNIERCWKLCRSELCVLIYTLSEATFGRQTSSIKYSGCLKTSLITIPDGWTYVNFKYSSYKWKRGKTVVPVRALNWRKVVKSPNNVVPAKLWTLLLAWGKLRRFEEIPPRKQPLWEFHLPGWREQMSDCRLFCLFPRGLAWRELNTVSSRSAGPQALFLHDVPQLTQVGLSDGVIGFQLKGPEVIGFSVLQLPVEVQDRS